MRRRLLAVSTVAGVAALGLWIESLPQPSATSPSPPGPAGPVVTPRPGYLNAEVNFPLAGELGIPLPGASLRRRLVTSSGRRDAWGGAIRQAAQRPIVGYGFGTEARAFIDRWSGFVGSVPENSYIGLALQLGVVGLVVFALLVSSLLAAGVDALFRHGVGVAAACLGALAAGLVLACVQSYVYSVGNIGTATLWIAAFLLPAAGVRSV